jgi:hypothetical protein
MEALKANLETDAAWQLSYQDIPELQDMRVTSSAVFLMDALESITEIYKNVKQIPQRLQFYEQVQHDLLIYYLRAVKKEFGRMERSGNRFSIFTVIQNHSTNGEDINKLTLIARWIASLDYVVRVLKEWNDSIVSHYTLH